MDFDKLGWFSLVDKIQNINHIKHHGSLRSDTNKVEINNPQKKSNPSKIFENNVPEEYKKVAEGMESQFARLMIEQMKKTVEKNEEGSSAQDFYDSVMTNEYADLMSKGDGLGLQKVILDQLYPQRLQNNFKKSLQNKNEIYIQQKDLKLTENEIKTGVQK
jgi:Rod binding domain-containing protein